MASAGSAFNFAAQQCVEAMRFLCDHDGEALAPVGFGEAHFDFHSELRGELGQARAKQIGI